MHNASFAAEGLDYVYVAMDVQPADLRSAVKGAVALGLRGFNVTMPHKQAMTSLVDRLDRAAELSGALNTVVIEGSELHGHSTDGTGLVEACHESGVELVGRRVLLLGAGGVSAPIALAFDAEGIAELHIVNRTHERARDLALELGRAGMRAAVEAHPYGALADVASGAEVVVNATSLGMRRDDPLPLSVEHLEEGTALCDAVYVPERDTPLVLKARERGVAVVTGKQMLLYQGVQAQRLFTGREPNVAAMRDCL